MVRRLPRRANAARSLGQALAARKYSALRCHRRALIPHYSLVAQHHSLSRCAYHLKQPGSARRAARPEPARRAQATFYQPVSFWSVRSQSCQGPISPTSPPTWCAKPPIDPCHFPHRCRARPFADHEQRGGGFRAPRRSRNDAFPSLVRPRAFGDLPRRRGQRLPPEGLQARHDRRIALPSRMQGRMLSGPDMGPPVGRPATYYTSSASFILIGDGGRGRRLSTPRAAAAGPAAADNKAQRSMRIAPSSCRSTSTSSGTDSGVFSRFGGSGHHGGCSAGSSALSSEPRRRVRHRRATGNIFTSSAPPQASLRTPSIYDEGQRWCLDRRVDRRAFAALALFWLFTLMRWKPVLKPVKSRIAARSRAPSSVP